MPKKSVHIPRFQTADEAARSLGIYGGLEREIAQIESDLAEKVAMLRADADTRLAPLQTELATTLLGLEAFAKNARSTLPSGQKTIHLSTGDLGWRIGNPTVSLKGKADAIIARIKEVGTAYAKRYVRTKESLDRPALLRDRPSIEGVRYASGRERFYVVARSDVSEAKAVIETN